MYKRFRKAIFTLFLLWILLGSFVVVLNFGVVPPVQAANSTFGRTEVGGSETYDWVRDGGFGSVFTLSEDGTVYDISAYITGDNWGANTFAVIYEDNAGATGDRVGYSTNITISGAGYEWHNFTLTSPVSVSAGAFWIMVMSNSSGNRAFHYEDATDNFATDDDVNGGGVNPYPPPTTISPSYLNYSMSIYATYTPDDSGSYVTVEDGHFVKDGNPIYFFGTNVYANVSEVWQHNTWGALSIPMMDLLVDSGQNFVRLWTSMEKIMPTYNEFNSTYYDDIFLPICTQLSEREIYYMLTIYRGDEAIPWMSSTSSVWNETTFSAYLNVWGNVSSDLSTDEFFLGADIPYNEAGMYPACVPYMDGSDWATGNITCMWNFWLEDRYTTTAALNATWNYNARTQLDADESVFITDWNDTADYGVRLPDSILDDTTYGDDYRMSDYRLFVGYYYMNMTTRLATRITDNCAHALIAWAPSMLGFYDATIPDCVDILEFHSYFQDPPTETQRMNQLFDYLQRDKQRFLINSDYPIFAGEEGVNSQGGGDDPYPVSDNFAAQHYIYGVDMMAWFAWEFNGGYGQLENGVLTPTIDETYGRHLVLEWADAYKRGTIERNPEVLFITSTGFSSIENILSKCGVQFAKANMYAGEIDSVIFNNYEMIIVEVGGYMPNSTLIAVREWAEAGNGTAVLLPNSNWCDEHHKELSWDDTGIDYDYWIMNYKIWRNWSPSSPCNVTVNIGFGGLETLEVFGVTDVGSSIRQPYRSDFVTGAEFLLNYTQNGNDYGLLVRNATGNVYFLADTGSSTTPFPADVGWLKIWRAMLNATGILNQAEPQDILEVNNVANGYIVFQEHNITSGTVQRTVNLVTDVNTSRSYVLYDVNTHNNITLLSNPQYIGKYSGTTLQSGIELTFKAFHTRLIRVIDTIEPDYVYLSEGHILSSTWNSTNSTRTVTCYGTNQTVSEIEFYFEDMSSDVKVKFGNSTVVNAENYYNSTTKLITIPFIYESEIIISVYDLGGEPPNVYLTITDPQNTTYSTSTIPVQLSASGGIIDKIWWNCWNGSWIYETNQTYTTPTNMQNFVNGTTYQFYGWVNNTDAEEDEETVWFTVSISALEPEAYQYSIDFTNQKVYVQLRYGGTEDPVPTANCSYAETLMLTNSTGWAEFDLTSLSDFNYNTTAYPSSYPSNNISVPLAKKTYAIQSVTNISHTITNLQLANNILSWSATGTGNTSFKIYSIDTPYYLKINNVVKLQGDSWSKSGNIITVTDTLGSTHDYVLSWTALSNDPGPGPYNPPDDVLDDFVENVIVPGSSFVEENQVILAIFAAIGVIVVVGVAVLVKIRDGAS